MRYKHPIDFIENGGLGDRVPFILLSEKDLDLCIKGADEVRKLGTREYQVFIYIMAGSSRFE